MGLTGGEMFVYRITAAVIWICLTLRSRSMGLSSVSKRTFTELQAHSLYLDILGHSAADGFRKTVWFPGATRHGLNKMTLNSGLRLTRPSEQECREASPRYETG